MIRTRTRATAAPRRRPLLVSAVGLALAVTSSTGVVSGAAPPAFSLAPTTGSDAADDHEPSGDRPARTSGGHRRGWVSTWYASPTGPNTVRQGTCPSDRGLRDQTVRNIVVPLTSGRSVRVRLSNQFGRRPLRVGSASLARARGEGPAVVPHTRRALRFEGRRGVMVRPGRTVLSDPLRVQVRAGRELSLSVHARGRTGPATQHNGANQTSYLAHGGVTGSIDGRVYERRPISCWLFAQSIEVRPVLRVRGAVVTLGDSLTDGFGSTIDRDRRYPDARARMLRAGRGPTLAVNNAGINGNTLLRPVAGIPAFGQPVLKRLRRDVLTRPRVTAVVVLIGVNDIGTNRESARALIAGHRRLAVRLQRAGLHTVAMTLPPFGGSTATLGGNYGTPRGERTRRALNRWLRATSVYDIVLDADRVLRDPAAPRRLRPRYDSGDRLHPNDAGYAALAKSLELASLHQRDL